MSYHNTKSARPRSRHRGLKFLLFSLVACAMIVYTLQYLAPDEITDAVVSPPSYGTGDGTFQSELEAFAQENSLDLSVWPKDLLESGEKNPEIREFVLNYPLKQDADPEYDLKEYANSDQVPLLLQWDQRWGYREYAGGPIGLTGCGPTCLSMVSIYLLHDAKYTPEYIAEFSTKHGYSVTGSGSAWALISEGGEALGLDVTEIPLDENRIIRNLEVGNPIICIMGPGDFTSTGHFIVMTEYVDGQIKINDPNSPLRSQQLWDYEQIKGQILNLWVCRSL